MIEFTLNNELVSLDIDPDMPLLWALRETLQKTGTKFGCGQGLCGACTVLINGNATRSCVLPMASISGQQVTTIEGLDGEHIVQRAWLEENVSQCGYCQPGQILTTVALLSHNAAPSDEQIQTALAGNICRCGTYPRILKAVQRATVLMNEASASGVDYSDPEPQEATEQKNTLQQKEAAQ
jgi:isoquinoline 1-oxidoreductase alpha subunit